MTKSGGTNHEQEDSSNRIREQSIRRAKRNTRGGNVTEFDVMGGYLDDASSGTEREHDCRGNSAFDIIEAQEVRIETSHSESDDKRVADSVKYEPDGAEFAVG